MKITDNVYLLDSTKGAYVYLITGDETLLIDTGFPWKGRSILKELEAMGIEPGKIKYILLTHNDIDHIGNAALLQELTGADVLVSAEDLPAILGTEDRKGFKKYLKYIFKAKRPASLKTFEPGADICGVRVIPTPGHTPGHVCFLYKDVLFAGDLIKSQGDRFIPFPGGMNWDIPMVLQSYDKISGYPFKWVCPAHSPPAERSGRMPSAPGV